MTAPPLRRVDTTGVRGHDRGMARALAALWLCLVAPTAATIQDTGLLRIRIALAGADQVATPVRRHLLLISDNPSSAPPRRVFTAQDGTAELRLRPGNYTVESDRPVAFEGRSYQWTQIVDLTAGTDTVLELTAANADVGVGPATSTTPSSSVLDEDRASLTARWQESVVRVWTPTSHASGAVVDASGLVVTTYQPIGTATTVEVQFSPTRKVPGQVVATDAERDVAVVRIDQATAAAVTAVPLGCGQSPQVPATGDEIVALEAPLGQGKGAVSGVVRRVATRILESDLAPAPGGAGGPVFSTRGVLLGITSDGDERMRQNNADTRVVRAGEVCAVVDLARAKLAGAAPLPVTALPVEPAAPFPTSGLGEPETLLTRHPPFHATSARFDVAFLTPVHVFGGQRAATQGRSMQVGAAWQRSRLATDFANWADYVADLPPVVFIRVTPKLVESVWLKIARGAAYTQGVALPPITRLSSGFARMRVRCGEAEVTPVHPFVLEIEGPGGETITEGLYAFTPDALTPACGALRLELYAVKDPAKADVLAVEPKLVEQVWADFTSYRALPR